MSFRSKFSGVPAFLAFAAFVPAVLGEGTAGASSVLGGFESLPAELGGDFSLGETDPFDVEPIPAQVLARKGRFEGKIFISANGAEDGELSAAFDIAKWLGRVMEISAEIPVETEDPAPRSLAEIPTGIYIGNTRAAAALGIFAPAGEGETSLIETRGNAVFIVGKTPAAVQSAAAQFLREVLGISFVWPGDDGAEWTPRDEIAFPRVRIETLPAFPWRLIGCGNDEWRVHLGFGEIPRFSHNLHSIFTPELYEKQPQLAPIVHGVRRANIAGWRAPQPNLADTAAVPAAVAAAKKYFEKNPAAPMFSLGVNDSTNWDESADSADAYGMLRFYRNLPNRSDYYFKFVNRTAEAFAADAALAGKSVGAIAYLDVQQAPSFPLRENVVPVLCADRSMWVFPEFKIEDKELIRRWAASGVRTWGVYDYYYGSPYVFPRVFLEEEAEAIKFLHEAGAKIFYAECGPIAAFDAPKIWLAAELLRNPEADASAILDDYYEKAFGEAASAMKHFYACCGEIWKEQGGQTRWIKAWNNENAAEIFPAEKLRTLSAALSEAVSAVRNAGERAAGMRADAQNVFAGTTAQKGSGNADSAGIDAQLAAADYELARSRRIAARLAQIADALRRAEKFSQSYFARKQLSQAGEDFEGTLNALLSNAWRSEEIFDRTAFTAHTGRADISKIAFADPRPAALSRVLEFLKNAKETDEKMQVERALERVFAAAVRSRTEFPEEKSAAVRSAAGTNFVDAEPAGTSDNSLALAREAADARLQLIAEAVPFFDVAPAFREDFEAENFSAFAPGDWRAGKNLTYPGSWRPILSAAENLEFGPSENAPHGGKTALRVAGKAERAELVRTFSCPAGKKVLAQVYARGNVSCGAISALELEFFGANGKALLRTSDALFVGKTQNWRRLIALGEAPAGTRGVRVHLYVGDQAEEDETFFDDFSLTHF